MKGSLCREFLRPDEGREEEKKNYYFRAQKMLGRMFFRAHTSLHWSRYLHYHTLAGGDQGSIHLLEVNV